MQTVEEIQQAIEALSDEDYKRIREWFTEADWDDWDRQIAADSEAGRLDFLAEEAERDRRLGRLRNLPGFESS